ncbi:PQQ-dependent sugar dehydrogenase [Parvibaculum sp.]|uniref:PQQ-dependent sugar dehydrogenase n=1 Tax=Parvibaculum sp. TaxID=2024848 RepID=UPI0034A08158
MSKRILGLALTISLSGALAGAAIAQEPAAADYRIVPVAEGLDHPWSLTFLPDGSMLVVELSGQIRSIKDGTLSPDPVAGIPPVFFRSQGGLFDAVLHPDFATNRLLYLSYVHGTAGANALRVARARFDGASLHDLEVIFEVEPLKDTPVHYGGRLLFLPDGTLLVTTGDGFDYREHAQMLDNHLGKIIRINDDGSVPADNPFVGRDDALPQIWSYGHRNVQGILHDSATGRVYAHEHGAQGGDEINVIEPGKNYGWPVITHGIDYSGARISPFVEYEGMEQPLLHWTPSIAPAGFTLYRGDRFPQWRGDLFVGALAGQHVRRVHLVDGAVAGQEELFGELGQRIREVRAGPDGYLYLLTDKENGSLLRVMPAE